MRVPWLEWREESPAWRALLLPLDGVAAVHRAITRIHRASYHRGWRRRRQLTCRVVSVGNLSVGGSGKTPTAAWIAAGLHARGYKTVLATRGHGRERSEPITVVSDGRHIHGDHHTRGDEPMVLASSVAAGVPILVGPDRGLAGLRAVSVYGAQVLVLDDGFQHHRLHRDVDIVTVDGGVGFGNGRTFPRGPLREPFDGIGRADAIGIVDGPLWSVQERRIQAAAPDALRFDARRRPTTLRSLRSGAEASPEVMRGMEVGLICGIAQPDTLRRTVEALGARVIAERIFPDHHRYRERDVQRLATEAPIWITTEKDAFKILPSWLRGADVRVLEVRLEVEKGAALLDWLEGRLFGPRAEPRRMTSARPDRCRRERESATELEAG